VLLQDSRKLGIGLVLVSAVLWSTAGLFIRMAALDVWSAVAWPSIFKAVFLGLYLAARGSPKHRGPARSFGWPGVISTALSIIGAVTYVGALTWTSVANVMTVYAALPFLATAVAFLWLGERVSLRFLIAGAVAAGGIGLTVGAAIAPRDLLGIGTAVVMTLSFASQLVIAKRHPLLDNTLMLVLSATACSVIALPFMQWSVPQPQQLLACAGYGILTTGLGYILVLIGGRLIGSGEASLLSMLDVVLGPLWVWLIYDEQISVSTGIGGGAVLVAVLWYLSGAPAPKAVQPA
jgi:drug/metabolite transporter (DMT)-like permease